MSAAAQQEPCAHPSLKCTVVRADLLAALLAVAPMVGHADTIPILSGVLLTVIDGLVRLMTANMDCWLEVEIPAVCEWAGSTVIGDAKSFLNLVNELEDGPVELVEAGDALSLNSASVAAEFGTMNPDDFPIRKSPAISGLDFEFDGAELLKSIDRVAFAISTEERHYYLNGIHLYSRNGWPCLVATDGYRLAVSVIGHAPDSPAPPAGNYGFIIPTRAVNPLRSLAKRGTVNLRAWPASNWLIAEQGGRILRCKLVDGTFPDIQRVIPTIQYQAVLPSGPIRVAAQRISKATRSNSSEVRLLLEGAVAILSCRTADDIKITETISLPSQPSKRFEVGLNVTYLKEALKEFDGEVNFGWITKDDQLLFWPGDIAFAETSHFVVQMPMRI